MSLFRQTSTSFADAKHWVAKQVSKTSTPEMLDRAGEAIQDAIQDWNRYNWMWAVTSPPDGYRDPYPVAIGQEFYDLPYNFKDVYDIVVQTGNSYRALRQDSKRNYDRSVPFPFNSFTVAYNLLRVGDRGQLQIQNPPDSPGTLKLLYHRALTEPCSVTGTCTFRVDNGLNAYAGAMPPDVTASYFLPYIVVPGATASRIKPGNFLKASKTGLGTLAVGVVEQVHINDDDTAFISFSPRVAQASTSPITNVDFVAGGDNRPIDIPADHKIGLLSKATEIFVSSIGASDQRLAYWHQAAERGIDKALAAQGDKSDMDLTFEPSYFNSFNPNRVPE